MKFIKGEGPKPARRYALVAKALRAAGHDVKKDDYEQLDRAWEIYQITHALYHDAGCSCGL